MQLLPVETLQHLTGQRVCRAFGHALSAGPGILVASPLPSVDGALADLVDACPVPWAEACAVLDTRPGVGVNPADPGFSPAVHRLAALAGEGWRFAALPELKALVFGNDFCGLRVALAMDMAFAKEVAHA